MADKQKQALKSLFDAAYDRGIFASGMERFHCCASILPEQSRELGFLPFEKIIFLYLFT